MFTKTLYAVFIGINGYSSKPLSGCINDVLAVNDYFQRLCKSQPTEGRENIHFVPLYLLAPNYEAEVAMLQARGIVYQSPTRANIIKAFDHFRAADPQRGDYCLLNYSGHGSFISAPAAFAAYEPTGQLETIVCVDSRETGGRDLLDKELGYLISDVLQGKEPNETQPGVHFLAWMDCCHSGSNTRANEKDIKARMEKGIYDEIAPEDILGFDWNGNHFYQSVSKEEQKVKSLRHARYISLSAARPHELAQEMTFEVVGTNSDTGTMELRKYGVFTYSTLKTLERSGVNISYQELIQRVELEVRSRVDKQIPSLEVTDFTDSNLFFFRNELQTPKVEYEVGHRNTMNGVEWFMNAGAIQGIVPSSAVGDTIVKILDSDKDRKVRVTEVRATEAILDSAGFNLVDREKQLKAVIAQMTYPQIKISFDEQLPSKMQKELEDNWNMGNFKYITIAEHPATANYIVRELKDVKGISNFILTRPGSDVPLFNRHVFAKNFLLDTHQVGRWESILKISNPGTNIPRENLLVEIEKVEGVLLKPETLNEAQSIILPPNTNEVSLQYTYSEIGNKKKPIQPGIRMHITNKSHQSYWVGALYLDSQFGITHEYLPVQEIGNSTTPKTSLQYKYKGVGYNMVPISMDNKYHEYGITNITDYIILFVATNKFDLSRFQQPPLELDTSNRAGRLDWEDYEPRDDWFTIKIPVHLHYPMQAITINGANPVKFTNFFSPSLPNKQVLTVIAPEGFKATIQPVTLSNARNTADQMQKSRSEIDLKSLVPPASLWEDTESSEAIFSRGFNNQPDNHISILELTEVAGSINSSHPLTLVPGDELAQEESIVPFAYDPYSSLYFVVGYTNEEGQVKVTQLPSLTPGIIGGESQNLNKTDRSLGGSIKLFFKKIIWSRLSGKQDYHQLSLIRKNELGVLEKIHDNGQIEIIREQLTGANTNNILLLLHGIIGDTKDLCEGVFNKTAIYNHFDAVLAFNYENLDTPIEDIAEELKVRLEKCGVFEIVQKRLTIAAHSMGGLVARCFIEDLGGASVTKKLIQLGTPNGGSEIASFRQKVSGLITFGINGAAWVKPYLPVLAFISRGISKRLFRTLDQMAPESDFLKKIHNISRKPEVPYCIIIGNTSEISANFRQDDPLWRKLWVCIRDRGKYILLDQIFFSNEPNDMAVKVESMELLPWEFEQKETIECDHLSYFSFDQSLSLIQRFL